MRQTKRRGFTLVEVVIAVAIAAVVMGGAMIYLFQGNRQFYKTTEHVSFRAEAMLVMEHIARDMEQLMVSPEVVPGTTEYSLLAPYKFTQEAGVEWFNPETEQLETVPGGRGIEFYKFHHIDPTGGPPLVSQNGAPTPAMVGNKVVYRTVPVDAGDASKGMNLLRNDKQINTIPLKDFFFKKEPAITAANQVQGSDHAILTVLIIPNGGMFGNFGTQYKDVKDEQIQRMRKEGKLVSRTFHLTGYESMYTAYLFRAMMRVNAFMNANNGQPASGAYNSMSDLEVALYQDAYAGGVPQVLLDNIQAQVAAGNAAPPNTIPGFAFKLEDQVFDDTTSGGDTGFLGAPVQQATEADAGAIGGGGFGANGPPEGGGGGGSGGSGGSSGS